LVEYVLAIAGKRSGLGEDEDAVLDCDAFHDRPSNGYLLG
jgi:hypothetical protein